MELACLAMAGFASACLPRQLSEGLEGIYLWRGVKLGRRFLATGTTVRKGGATWRIAVARRETWEWVSRKGRQGSREFKRLYFSAIPLRPLRPLR